jgi:glucose dehydrogenase
MNNQTASQIPAGYSFLGKNEKCGFSVYGTLHPHVSAICLDNVKGDELWHYRFKDQSHLQKRIAKTVKEFNQYFA